MALTFSAVNRHILLRRSHLLKVPMSLEQRRAAFRRTISGVAPYAVAAGLAAVSPYITLGVSAALAAFYALPLANLQAVAAESAD